MNKLMYMSFRYKYIITTNEHKGGTLTKDHLVNTPKLNITIPAS